MSGHDQILHKFLDDREQLTDAELRELAETLGTQPAAADLLKDQLIIDELLSQQLAVGRSDFVARVSHRLSELDDALQLPSQLLSNTSDRPTAISRSAVPAEREGGNGRPAIATPHAESSLPPIVPTTISLPLEHSGEVGELSHERRSALRLLTGIAVVLCLGFAWLLWNSFTPRIRKIAVVEAAADDAIIHRGASRLVAAPRMVILPGDLLESGADPIEISYRDRTRLTLSPYTVVRMQPSPLTVGEKENPPTGKHLVLKTGSIHTIIAAGQRPPFVLESNRLQVSMSSGEVAFSVREGKSRVRVISGKATVRDTSAETLRTVTQGEPPYVPDHFE